MAIPEKPESRAEMYLNKIASGSGTIPAQPESRLEQYLDVIANNGGGGGSGGGSGGVDMVNVTFACSRDNYGVGFNIPVVVDNDTKYGAYYSVSPESPIAVKLPKYATGAIHIDLSGGAIALGNIDKSVMPEVTGNGTIDFATGFWIINGDCTFTAAGIKGT